MDNRVQIGLAPCTILLDLLDLALVRPLKDSVTGNVVPLLAHVFAHYAENFLVMDTCGLKQANKIVNRIMAIRASMRLANTRVVIAQDLLARVWGIATATTVYITTNITIGMANVVLVLGVEFVVRLAFEGLPPEDDTLLQRETDALQEERIL